MNPNDAKVYGYYALAGMLVGTGVSYAMATPFERSKPDYHPKLLWGTALGTAFALFLIPRPKVTS